jgi:apolipoprotein N-acyltransferase
VGVAFFVGVSSLMAAPYYVLFALYGRTLLRRGTSVTPLLVAAAWVGAEVARGRIFAGNPWGLFGYTQMGRDALVQIADVTSVYGIGFVLVAVNAAVAALVTAMPADSRSPAASRSASGATARGGSGPPTSRAATRCASRWCRGISTSAPSGARISTVRTSTCTCG